MAHGILNRSSSNPCPICGKPDWCGSYPIGEGMHFAICNRHLVGDDVIGVDGKRYVYCGKTSGGNARYEEEQQHLKREHTKTSDWIQEDRMNACPICGDTYACKRLISKSSDTCFELCFHNRSGKNVKSRVNGKWYTYASDTKDGQFARYEESEARKQRISKWREENSNAKPREFHKVSYEKKNSGSEEFIRDNKYLDKIYRYLLDCLELEPMHRAYLLQESWTPELIDKHNIKSFPEADIIRYKFNHPTDSGNLYRKALAAKITERFGEDSLFGVPGAYRNKNGEWTFAGRKGILFPLYDANGYLYRLRIRMDFLDVENELFLYGNNDPCYKENGEYHYIQPMKGVYTFVNGEKCFKKNTKGKYRNFSSTGYADGCSAGNQLGIYFEEKNHSYVCFITEGEKKGIFCNHRMNTPFISVPGVNSWSKLLEGIVGERVIDILKKKEVFMFVIAYDSDKETNAAVLKNEQSVIEALKEEGFSVGIAEWDMLLGKGIDDLLAKGYEPNYSYA